MSKERLNLLFERFEKEEMPKKLFNDVKKVFDEEIVPLMIDMTLEKAINVYVNPKGKPTRNQLLVRNVLWTCGLSKLIELPEK